MRVLRRLGIAATAGLTLAAVGVAVPRIMDQDAGSSGSAGQATHAAGAATNATDATASDDSAGAVAPEPVLKAMQRDLGLSEQDAVLRVLAEDAARTTDASLRARLGARYAGSYLNKDGNTLTVAVTDRAAAKIVTAAHAIPVVVTRSAGELARVKAALDAHPAPAEVVGYFVDVRSNSVHLTTRSRAAAEAFVATAGVRGKVTIEVTDEQPRPLADVRGGEAYLINNRFRCSIGFPVEGGFVTAGHCGAAGDKTAGSNGVAQGTVTESIFPGNDMGHVVVNANWTPQPWVKGASAENVLVTDSQVAVVGSSVCRSGSTTGWHCGTIQSTNNTIRYPEGQVSGMTRTNVCAEPGDSGGSWISGSQAQGVTSGGSGNCTSANCAAIVSAS